MADRNVRAVRANGKKPVCKLYPKTASTAFDKNSLVEFASGVVNPSDDNDITVFGIILEEVATTDSDYATTGSNGGKLVELLQPDTEVEIDADKTATVGTAYGISNAYTIDVDDTTNKVFTVTAVLSSTRVRGVFKTVFGSNNL